MTATLNEVRLLAGRSLRHIPRIPEKVFGAVLMPLVFVLLFAYVFGSAINVPGGGDYHEYLVSGIFAQSMIGTIPGIAVGVASDIRSGLMDRLRALPIARGIVIAGRTVAELVELSAGTVVVAVCGLIVGWAPHGSVARHARRVRPAARDGVRRDLGGRVDRADGARPRRRRRHRDEP